MFILFIISYFENFKKYYVYEELSIFSNKGFKN